MEPEWASGALQFRPTRHLRVQLLQRTPIRFELGALMRAPPMLGESSRKAPGECAGAEDQHSEPRHAQPEYGHQAHPEHQCCGGFAHRSYGPGNGLNKRLTRIAPHGFLRVENEHTPDGPPELPEYDLLKNKGENKEYYNSKQDLTLRGRFAGSAPL